MTFNVKISVALLAATGVGAAVAIPAIENARKSTERLMKTNNLKKTILGVHYFHDIHNRLVAPFSVDSDGKRLHSWRVYLLPYIGEVDLYKKIRLDEPWDSEWNRQFHDQTPSLYQGDGADPSECWYSQVVDEESTFQPIGFKDCVGRKTLAIVTDGTSNTVALVQRAEPCCWMDPDSNLTIDEFIKPDDYNEAALRCLCDPNDGKAVNIK